MKTTTTAAILLLSGTIFFSQASLAGKKGAKPPLKDCTFIATSPATACTDKIAAASTRLSDSKAAFSSKRGAQNFEGLSCKVALAEVKMGKDKAEDAYYKLTDSALKIETLRNQGKLDISDDQYELLKGAFDDAADCAYKVAFPK
jgi:hypothetical protein